MLLIKHIRTATLDTLRQNIIPASSVICICMHRQGLNCQFRINGHSATNMLKATWPNPTPIKMQSQQEELYFTGKDNSSLSPSRSYHTRKLSQARRPVFLRNVHEVGRQWRLFVHLLPQGTPTFSNASRCILEITDTLQPMPRYPARAQIPAL